MFKGAATQDIFPTVQVKTGTVLTCDIVHAKEPGHILHILHLLKTVSFMDWESQNRALLNETTWCSPYIREMKAAFEGCFELGQPCHADWDQIGRSTYPSKDAVPEMEHCNSLWLEQAALSNLLPRHNPNF